MERAERLYRQGDYDGAWLEIEELQPIERVMPEPVDLRLRICIATGRWSMGENLASVMQFADQQEFRITAGECYYGYVRHLCGEG